MPWVFTYNDWSSGTEYDQMVKGAVTSAIEAARMKPHCMFSGSQSSEMYRWLVGKGVRIIRVSSVLDSRSGWGCLRAFQPGGASSVRVGGMQVQAAMCACNAHSLVH